MGLKPDFLNQLLFFSSLSLFLLVAAPSFGYVQTTTSKGAPILWKGPVKMNFVGNPTNQSQLSENDFYKSVVMSLQRWQAASSNEIQFDYWQGTATHNFPANSEYNGQSSIYFISNSTQPSNMTPTMLGLTQVWYNVDSGEILETDIALNDRDFHFTNSPTDTSGTGAGRATFTDGKNNVFVQNVITHELGHALGLAHSGGLQSTMLFMESPEQFHLGCDELIAIHALYPSSDAPERGSIAGTVISETGAAQLGVHVLAISRHRGTVLATAISNILGGFEFDGLEPGEYLLMAEPFYAGHQALPEYYSSLNLNICSGGRPFGRSFLFQNDGYHLASITALPSKKSVAPPISLHCGNASEAFLAEIPETSSATHPPVIFKGDQQESGFGVANKITHLQPTYYRLSGVSGRLEIHALGYSLYSPIHPSISLATLEGVPIVTQVTDPVYTGDSGYIDRDSSLVVNELPLGDYLLQVSIQFQQINDYPAGALALDGVPFLVLTGSSNEKDVPLAETIPTNARCRMLEDFPYYNPPIASPPHHMIQSPNTQTGFCGTVNSSSSNEKPHPQISEIIGWFIPWIFMAIASRTVILKEWL